MLIHQDNLLVPGLGQNPTVPEPVEQYSLLPEFCWYHKEGSGPWFWSEFLHVAWTDSSGDPVGPIGGSGPDRRD